MSSYRSLQDRLELHRDLPITPDWSAAADFLHLLADFCLIHKPATVLECSSGLTSLVLARCCQINQCGHLYSLENGEEYAANTLHSLTNNGLGEYATVLHAPLELTIIDDTEYMWYAQRNIPDKNIDLLVIDGPPGFTQRQARYPALPLLYDRLSPHATVFLDDAARDDEQQVVTQWRQRYPDMQYESIPTERGCVVLRKIF